MLRQMIGSRKIVPPSSLRIVPFGERHICLRPNSLTRASSGVIVAHFTPTPYLRIARAESSVILSSVLSRDSIAEIVILEVYVQVRQDQALANHVPDDARHLVPVELDERCLDLDLSHAKRNLRLANSRLFAPR